MTRLVVVGGSAAGMSAAAKAKRVNKKLEVVAFERSRYVSYAPCGIPYYVEGLVKKLDDLVYYTAEYFRKERGIDVRSRHEVLDIDANAKKVVAKDLNKDEVLEMRYDYLVLATGGKPLTPETLSAKADGVYTVRTLEDGERINVACERARTIGVIGGGYIGLEMAEAFRLRNKRVLLFQRSFLMSRAVDLEISKDIEDELSKHDVTAHLGEAVKGFRFRGKVMHITTDKGEYPVDMVVLAIGVKPNVDLAGKIGVELGVTGAIKVNERMRTSLENVYAAGDNVETAHLVSGNPTYLPFAPAANKMGRVAGDNVAGGSSVFKGVLGTAFTKVFNLHVGRTGLSLRQAREVGFDAVAMDMKHISRSHYYPGGEQIHVRLVADKESHRLLGGAITGKEGVAGRVNALASALWGRLTVEDLTQLDLGYQPVFAPVWDGLIVAANIIKRRL